MRDILFISVCNGLIWAGASAFLFHKYADIAFIAGFVAAFLVQCVVFNPCQGEPGAG